MVGEIRDKITAEIAVKLANTGHLTFSTLHTNDAPSVVTRLYKMGIEPFLLAYSINLSLLNVWCVHSASLQASHQQGTLGCSITDGYYRRRTGQRKDL